MRRPFAGAACSMSLTCDKQGAVKLLSFARVADESRKLTRPPSENTEASGGMH
jgi:hypothetical protein